MTLLENLQMLEGAVVEGSCERAICLSIAPAGLLFRCLKLKLAEEALHEYAYIPLSKMQEMLPAKLSAEELKMLDGFMVSTITYDGETVDDSFSMEWAFIRPDISIGDEPFLASLADRELDQDVEILDDDGEEEFDLDDPIITVGIIFLTKESMDHIVFE